MKPLDRRGFLKISGATVIGGLVGSVGLLPAPEARGAVQDHSVIPDRVVPTFCELCFWKCGVLAYVKDEKVYKLEGNPKHPLSNGKLCPRGTGGGIGALYDPDRLQPPAHSHPRGRRGEVARGRAGTRRSATPPSGSHEVKEQVRRPEHRAVLPRPRRRVLQDAGEGPGQHHHLRPVERPVPRAARGGLRAHLRRGRWARSRPSTFPTPSASPSSARTSARTCTTPRCRTCRRPAPRAPPSSPSTRASPSSPASRSTGCPSSRAPTPRCCSPGPTSSSPRGCYDKDFVAAQRVRASTSSRRT